MKGSGQTIFLVPMPELNWELPFAELVHIDADDIRIIVKP